MTQIIGYSDPATRALSLEVVGPRHVEFQIRADGKVAWLHVDGITVLRLSRINDEITITDERPKPSVTSNDPTDDVLAKEYQANEE